MVSHLGDVCVVADFIIIFSKTKNGTSCSISWHKRGGELKIIRYTKKKTGVQTEDNKYASSQIRTNARQPAVVERQAVSHYCLIGRGKTRILMLFVRMQSKKATWQDGAKT